MSVLPVLVITKVASPALDVQAPVIVSEADGGGGGSWQGVISTTVVNEESSGEDNVYEVELPDTVIVILCPVCRLITPLSTTIPLASVTL